MDKHLLGQELDRILVQLRYCRISIGNLDELVGDGRIAWGTVVALDYGDAGEVQSFIEETGVSLPVLMGTRMTASDWSIRGFPWNPRS